MPICKFCGKVIKELQQRRRGIEKSRFYIDDEGYSTYSEEDFDSDGEYYEYRCYECDEILFDNWEEAEEFLKNEDKVAEMVAKKIQKEKK